MTKTCPTCGFVSKEEARFCRMCGAPLPRASGEFGGEGAISPSAATVPLSELRQTTGELSPHDTVSTDRARTANLRREEMDEFLRRAADAHADPHEAPPPTHAADAADARPTALGDGDRAFRVEDGERPITIRVRSIEAEPRGDALETAPPGSPFVASTGEDAAAGAIKLADSKAPAPRATEDRALRIWGGAAILGIVALLTAAAVALVWFAAHSLRRQPPPTPSGASPNAATSAPADASRATAVTDKGDVRETNAGNPAAGGVPPVRRANASPARTPQPSKPESIKSEPVKPEAKKIVVAALPASASPREHFERGEQLWGEDRRAALAEFAAAAQRGNRDANYYLGLGAARGRDPRSLKRGELVAALTYFQRARRSRFSAEARRYEDSLGKEFDRRLAAERAQPVPTPR